MVFRYNQSSSSGMLDIIDRFAVASWCLLVALSSSRPKVSDDRSESRVKIDAEKRNLRSKLSIYRNFDEFNSTLNHVSLKNCKHKNGSTGSNVCISGFRKVRCRDAGQKSAMN